MRRDWQRRLQRLEQAAAALPGKGPSWSCSTPEEGYAFHGPHGRRYDWAGRDTWPAWDDGQCNGSLAEAQAHLTPAELNPRRSSRSSSESRRPGTRREDAMRARSGRRQVVGGMRPVQRDERPHMLTCGVSKTIEPGDQCELEVNNYVDPTVSVV